MGPTIALRNRGRNYAGGKPPAGYAPLYGEREVAAPELEHVRRALEFILRQQALGHHHAH